MEQQKFFANRHIPSLLAIPEIDPNASTAVQVIHNGEQLTAERILLNEDSTRCMKKPILIRDTAESIGMKLPVKHKKKSNNNNKKSGRSEASSSEASDAAALTVRDVADIVGHNTPVQVIDVEHQEELDGWTFADLVEYFEDEERILYTNRMKRLQQQQQQQQQQQHDGGGAAVASAAAASESSNRVSSRRPKRKAALNSSGGGNGGGAGGGTPRVLNQISFEFSRTALRNRVRSPELVRDIDWIDTAWSPAVRNAGLYPAVQYYCLTSAAGSYTDFHIDFGGSSVWYHVVSGQKVFCFVPPTASNLELYEQWLCSPDQAVQFFPDLLQGTDKSDSDDAFRMTVKENETLIIPAAWIHAVYTPDDSLVFGGNFLSGLDIKLQLAVHSMEVRTRVAERFRFPHFVPTQYYAAGMYLRQMRRGRIRHCEVSGLSALVDALEQWWNTYSQQQDDDDEENDGLRLPSVAGAAKYAAKQNRCDTVEEFLTALRQEHARVQRDGITPNPAYARMHLSMKRSSEHRGRDSSHSFSPRIRISQKMPSTAHSNDSEDDDSRGKKLRIRISPAASKCKPLPPPLFHATGIRAKEPPREGTNECDEHRQDGGGGEWLPLGVGSLSKSKSERWGATATATASTAARPCNSKERQLPPSPRPTKKNKMNTTTARQRLMKKVG